LPIRKTQVNGERGRNGDNWRENGDERTPIYLAAWMNHGRGKRQLRIGEFRAH
jgi:hypothetical protein